MPELSEKYEEMEQKMRDGEYWGNVFIYQLKADTGDAEALRRNINSEKCMKRPGRGAILGKGCGILSEDSQSGKQ